MSTSKPTSDLLSTAGSFGGSRDPYRSASADIAHRMQVDAGIRGGVKGLAVGALAILAAHARFPWMRRQTLAGKAFLACWPAAFGFSIAAENALSRFERDFQDYDNKVRQRAMRELGQQGKMATETNIRAWRNKNEEAVFSKAAAPTEQPQA